MATQSEIQSLLQALTGNQTVAQSNVPSSVNNGNPNTVYNSPLPTMMDAQGNWYRNTIGPAANMAGFSGFLPSGGVNVMRPVWNGSGATGQVPVNTPNSGNGNTPPPVQNGGNLPPSQVIDDVVRNILGGGAVGGGGNNMNSGGGGWDIPGSGGQGLFGMVGQNGLGGSGSNSGGAYSNDNGLFGIAPSIAAALGLNPNGGVDWQQALDWVIPGDVWNSQTDNWNQAGIIAAIADNFANIPGVDWVLNKIGEKQVTDDNPNNDNSWFARQYLNNTQNSLKNSQNEIVNKTTNDIVKNLNSQFKNMLDDQSKKMQDDAIAKAAIDAQNKMNALLGIQTPVAGSGLGSVGNFGNNVGSFSNGGGNSGFFGGSASQFGAGSLSNFGNNVSNFSGSSGGGGLGSGGIFGGGGGNFGQGSGGGGGGGGGGAGSGSKKQEVVTKDN